MATPYTLGIWKVKAGREAEFVAAWTEFARWTSGSAAGARAAVLLRDTADPARFLSVGPWESEDAIRAWRAMDGWKERVGRIRELLDGFEAATLALVAESD